METFEFNTGLTFEMFNDFTYTDFSKMEIEKEPVYSWSTDFFDQEVIPPNLSKVEKLQYKIKRYIKNKL